MKLKIALALALGIVAASLYRWHVWRNEWVLVLSFTEAQEGNYLYFPPGRYRTGFDGYLAQRKFRDVQLPHVGHVPMEGTAIVGAGHGKTIFESTPGEYRLGLFFNFKD